VFDPSTYVEGVPFDGLARLRHARPVIWVEEDPVLGWPGDRAFGWCSVTPMSRPS